jgi:uncharacterized protein (DUF39 family)
MAKSWEEINHRIASGSAVVVTAEEMTAIVRDRGVKAAARKVDVVTTGTFGPMCSSGVFINTGHASPKIKYRRAWLNGVPAGCGVAAVDLYMGATSIPGDDPANSRGPGEFRYGGGHVIEDLVRGRDIVLRAEGYGTDCYPRRSLERKISLRTLRDARLLNPRNAYQNYNVAVNSSAPRAIHTYMGILRPRMANAVFCSAGQLSPLLNDPLYRTIGTGTRIFLGGGTGYVVCQGTQHDPSVERTPGQLPMGGAGTISVTGDLKAMSPRFLRGVSMTGYGASLAVGIGIPIPVLDEEMAAFTGVSDSQILAPVVDYSVDYPEGAGSPLAHVSYADLRSGEIEVRGRKVSTAALSSYPMAREIATELRERITAGKFSLGIPVETLGGLP